MNFMKKKQNAVQADLDQATNEIVDYDYTPKNDITFNSLDTHIDLNGKNIKIVGKQKWYIRIWYILSNPFCYIFTGYVRY